MVGKPNFPEDVDARNDLKGGAAATPGLTALDEEREASLADEGGASGMRAETQDETEQHRRTDGAPGSGLELPPDAARRGRIGAWGLAGVVLAASVGALAYRRRGR